MSEDTPIIEVRDLHQRFGDHHVLRGVTAHVNRGETLVLLGGSGGGKSVLIKHFIGLISPYSGQVIVNGEDISNMNERQLGKVRQAMGMMFQSGALFDSMTVGQNIAFPLRERGITDEKEILKRVLECLDIVKLPGQASKMPADLSGGMRKRVALARAIVDRPECVLYDEPHAGLDPITGDAIDHLIKDLQKVHGMTNVIITHEMRSVFRIADRVIFLKDGQIYWEGTPQEMKDSGDLELLDFIDGIARED
jgi:phospholipid/cholesterol/gamma-HCH transport system ATP-binding protein